MPHIRRTAVQFPLLVLFSTIAFADPVKTANGLIEGTTLCRAAGRRAALESYLLLEQTCLKK